MKNKTEKQIKLEATIAESEKIIRLMRLQVLNLTKRINEKMKEIDEREIEINKLKNQLS